MNHNHSPHHSATGGLPTGQAGALLYICPMHPSVRESQPGRCPECGMDLIPEKKKASRSQSDRGSSMASPSGHADHAAHEGGIDQPSSTEVSAGKHAGHHTDDFLKKFIISAVLTVPVILLSDIGEIVFGVTLRTFPGAPYLAFALASLVFFYGGWVFLTSAWREMRARLPGMMTLIALATSAAYLWSVYVLISGFGMPLWWELTTLITVMLLGHWLEMRAVRGASAALKELSKLLPDVAEVVEQSANGKSQIATTIIPLAELKEGDVVVVRPGGRVPADGTVIEGRTEVNESMVTGESAPVLKTPGMEVIGGTVNGDGMLKVRVAKVGDHTFLAGIVRLVREAEASKSRLQLLSDRAALYLTYVAVGGGAITLGSWLAVGAPAGFAVERLVAVLVIACPHALGLAVPLVASLSTTLAARHGFLVKRRLALEAARSIDIVLFDKTGTLTKGEYGVTDIWPSDGVTEEELITLAAAVDTHSEHFISRAIIGEMKRKKLPVPESKDFTRIPGKGVKGVVNGATVFVGGERILEETRVQVSAELSRHAAEEGAKGKTVIYVVQGSEVRGAFALADIIREESREAIGALRAEGVEVAMLTGDSEAVAGWVARELGIEKVFARVLPGDKSAKVKLLQGEGKKVAMVGDGVNDAPALTQADLGIAIGAGTNIAVESAGIILMRNDPRDIPKIIRLSRATYRKMIQNLWWATGYNLAALPLAAGVLAGQGFILPPAVAAVFMSFSTVIVAVNAVLLRRVRLAAPR